MKKILMFIGIILILLIGLAWTPYGGYTIDGSNGNVTISEVELLKMHAITVGEDDTGYDLKLYGATASSYSLWDESADKWITNGADFQLNDDDYLLFGDATGGDVQISWNGTNLELAPVSGFWANCPNLAYPNPSGAFSFLEEFIGWTRFAATAGSAGGWKSAGDSTYDIVAAAGSIGGQIQLTPETGSNNEAYHQLGEIGTETFIEYVKSSGNKSWVEFRVAYTSITNAANIFIGLAEEGAAAGNFIHDDGNDFADKDLLGFVIWEANPDTVDVNHQKAGGTLADVGVASSIVAETYITFGIHFDGAETVTFYANGTAVGTADLDTATFPTGEELSPIIAIKNGAADGTLELDWIKMIVER